MAAVKVCVQVVFFRKRESTFEGELRRVLRTFESTMSPFKKNIQIIMKPLLK
jgi:hypothetical protein